MIALTDTDSLIYQVGHQFQDKVWWNKTEWILAKAEAKANGTEFTMEKEITITANLPATLKALDNKIEKIAAATGVTEMEMWLTGADNFRYNVLETYKHARDPSAKPIYFQEIWDYLVENYDVHIAVGWEADDICVYLKNHYPEKYILCAIDKDVLYQSVGTHYIYSKDEYVVVTENFANYYKYLQTIMGDSTDGYEGVKGIGIGGAIKFLGFPSDNEELMIKLCKKAPLSEKGIAKVIDIPQVDDLWDAVCLAYESKGLTEEDAIIQMRMADMTQLHSIGDDEYEIRLWEP